MPVPQVSDRIKEAPALVLRAVFAGIGQLLLAADRLRGHSEQPPRAPDRDERPTESHVRNNQPAETGNVRLLRPADPSLAEAATSPAEPATAADPSTAAGPAAVGGPSADTAPIPGYDDLSIASLRARMRVLDAAAVQRLLEYEKAHARRAEMITMFERRLVKLREQAP